MMMASTAVSGRSDDSVPAMLTGGFPSFETPRPASANDWERQKPELHKKPWRLLGDLPPLSTPKVTVQKRELRDGYTREHLTFQNGAGDTVYGYLLVPAGTGAGARHPVPSLPWRAVWARQGRTLPPGLRRRWETRRW